MYCHFKICLWYISVSHSGGGTYVYCRVLYILLNIGSRLSEIWSATHLNTVPNKLWRESLPKREQLTPKLGMTWHSGQVAVEVP